MFVYHALMFMLCHANACLWSLLDISHVCLVACSTLSCGFILCIQVLERHQKECIETGRNGGVWAPPEAILSTTLSHPHLVRGYKYAVCMHPAASSKGSYLRAMPIVVPLPAAQWGNCTCDMWLPAWSAWARSLKRSLSAHSP